MLQTNKSLNVSGAGNLSLPEIASPEQLVISFTSFLRRQFPIIVIVVLLTAAAGVVYLLTTPPMYTARASMIVDTRKVQLFRQQAMLSEPAIDTGMVDSEVEILKSENVSLAVIKHFHLAEDPEFIGQGGGLLGALIEWVSSLFGSDTPMSEFELTRRAAAAFANRLAVNRIGFSYVIQIGFSSLSPQRAADIANAVADAYITDQLNAKFEASRRAGLWLQDRLRELREQASVAQRAVVEFKATHNIVNTGGADRPLVNEQQVGELNSQLVIARAQVSESQARLDRIQAILRADSPNVTVDATVTDTFKDDVITKLRTQYVELADREADWSKRYGPNHLAVVNLRNQMAEIRNSILSELRRIGESYKSDYDIALQREAGVRDELAHAVTVSQGTDRAQVQMDELLSNAKSYRALYDDFLQRYMESVQQESFPITEARVVTPAARPLTKSSPKTLLVLLASAMGGLILGLGTGRLRDLSNRVFRTRAQVEAALGLDCLAVVPYIKGDKPQGDASDRNNGNIVGGPRLTDQAKESSKSLVRRVEAALGLAIMRYVKGDKPKADALGRKSDNIAAGLPKLEALAKELSKSPVREAVGKSFGQRTIAPAQNILWEVVESPLSPFTESIRSIKMAADITGGSKTNKIIGITSTFPNEGKSTIATSLAQLMSHSGGRVVLIDGDLRAPSLTHRLAPSAKAGLVEVVSGKASLDEVIWTDRSTNLSFLPTVAKSRLIHTAEILGTDEIKALFDQLRKAYDYVIVDLSPLVPIVDVRATKGLVDSYIFIVEWGKTKIDSVERALKEVPGIYDNIIGTVLNKADTSTVSRYEGYDGYYNHKYYQRYGYTE